ncbi:tripartite tricarboxylate transporter substrate binding protein [Ottowia sp. GY511]|uniref:Bug family tripartite tricarboxylate transporter substrate binding protein n=1 Tax=Ottowia flava TaxID=2675430 RepID=A0ABW4KS79_9BURK|nr:tripartite tricarboxylate transporter substrate binding protein [Ottowia sp. GY511]TXK26354.1 tripartite tricarboxylate transporter substrate binding protein [Ottowia sp. GY511]
MRKTFQLVATAVAAACFFGTALAQDTFPSRPIKIIVPWGAGSGIDVQVRQFADEFGKALKTPVIVENKVGAGSQIGYEVATKAEPNGYTLLAGSNANFIHQQIHPRAKLDPVRDLAPITMMFWMPSVLVVSKNSPAKDIPSFVSWIQQSPQGMNYGSGGVGSASHLLAAMIGQRNQLNVTHIPLRTLTADLGPMLTRGDIGFALPVTGVGAAQIDRGNVRPLAVTSSKRLPQWPDVPTLAEAFKDDIYLADSWTALFAPKGTPPQILDKLYAAAVQAVESKAHLQSAKLFHTIPAASPSRAAFAKLFQAEGDKWRTIVTESRMTPD